MGKSKTSRETKKEYHRRLIRQYMVENGVTEFDPDDVARWVIDRGYWTEGSYSKVKRCRHDLTAAMRDDYIYDPQGREVRAMQPWPVKSEGGQYIWRWGAIYSIPPNKFKLSLSTRRRAVLGECRQHRIDNLSYNDNNDFGADVGLFDLNFNTCLEEESQPTNYLDDDPGDELES